MRCLSIIDPGNEHESNPCFYETQSYHMTCIRPILMIFRQPWLLGADLPRPWSVLGHGLVHIFTGAGAGPETGGNGSQDYIEAIVNN